MLNKTHCAMQQNINILIVYHKLDRTNLLRWMFKEWTKIVASDEAVSLNIYYREVSDAKPSSNLTAQQIGIANDGYLHQTAQLIVPIVSSNLLASDFCVDYEDLYLQWHNMGDKQVLPVLWTACLINDSSLGKLDLLHTDFTPVAANPNRTTIVADMVVQLQQLAATAIEQLRGGLVFGKKASPAADRYHLLIIGIDNYVHFAPLQNAVKDAQAFAQVLTEQYNFLPQQTTLLLNHQATQASIDKQLRRLVQSVQPTDCVIIYYAGHGYYDAAMDEGYWLPYDAIQDTESDFIDNTISNTEIVQYIRRIKSLHTLLISDSCFSGTLFDTQKRSIANNKLSTFLRKVANEPSRWALTSGRKEVVADGVAGEHSPFALALLGELNNHSNKTYCLVSDLIRTVKQQVGNQQQQQPVGDRLREVGGSSTGEFVLYKKGVTTL